MKKINISIDIDYFSTKSELSSEFQNLLEKADEATKTSYSPYSNFQVGAAIELENGEIISGSNQENAAYPSGLCAERVAIFAAASRFPGVKIKNIAILARKKGSINHTPVAPCGSCRQVLVEYESNQKEPIRLVLRAEKEGYIIPQSISDLLPISFTKDNLM
jgi:cytidine deaminase